MAIQKVQADVLINRLHYVLINRLHYVLINRLHYVLINRLHYALPGWDGAEETHDAQGASTKAPRRGRLQIVWSSISALTT
jgi:hypothetical protein